MSRLPAGPRRVQPRQWDPLAVIPIIVGLFWLMLADGFGWWLWGLPPGLLMVVGGASLWLLPGDPRTPAVMALGAAVGVPAALLWIVFGSFFAGLLGLVGAAAVLLVAGRLGATRSDRPAEVPTPKLSTTLDLKVGIDEALLGYFVLGARLPSGNHAAQVCEQAVRFSEAVETLDYVRHPQRLHTAVAAPEEVTTESGRIYGRDYQSIRFETAFIADEQLPGAAIWNRLEANRQVTARVVRQGAAGRPWLVCIHGYRMGVPWLDMSLFSPSWLVDRLGVNLVQPVLPLHGPRRIGMRSGDHYLDGDPLDLFFAQAQALSDLRQTLAWIRHQDPEARIGVYGISLGGYNAALLSNYADDLDFVVAGIPVVDFTDALWRLLTPSHRRYFEAEGMDQAFYRSLLAPISPLHQPTRLAPDRRFLFAANCDRVVLPEHPLALAAHWETAVHWYQGSHLSVRRERVTRETVEQAMIAAGWPLPLL
ncbi:S9 family peptidase [Flagellatimonas centrodinii]|uniref:prolyl oligopeptidase family serine peptidase n=1 Tax=Flagellatimonas centrodinii TaxID=2806210 RepID=UPI001FEE2F96|nr:prolyl oligopeptidase family serine peptidase [Flagellatimonas centrodinii]ULQ46164.1 S9 family peptidase [Flagellatimonas centrodinii]